MKNRIEILRDFGDRVRELRLSRSYSQEKLADQCALDRTYVGGVERGERNPSLVALGKIAMGLDVSLAELFSGVLCSRGEADPKRTRD